MTLSHSLTWAQRRLLPGVEVRGHLSHLANAWGEGAGRDEAPGPASVSSTVVNLKTDPELSPWCKSIRLIFPAAQLSSNSAPRVLGHRNPFSNPGLKSLRFWNRVTDHGPETSGTRGLPGTAALRGNEKWLSLSTYYVPVLCAIAHSFSSFPPYSAPVSKVAAAPCDR